MHYLLIDSSYLQYRSYFAYPELTNSKKEPLGAIYGFVKSILSFQKNLAPDYVIFAKDLSGPTFRDLLYDQYKAGRLPTPPELKSQITQISELLVKTEASILARTGFEADDMIASAAFKLIFDPNSSNISSQNNQYNTDPELINQATTTLQTQNTVTIFSGDRDLYQLLAFPNVQMLISDRMGSTKILDAAGFVEKYELQPAQWLDYKAMVGDGSDNIKGIPGIGPKTATTLLKDHGSLADIYAHLGVDFIQELGSQYAYTNHQTAANSQKPIAEKLALKLKNNIAEVVLSYRLSKLAFPVIEIENKNWKLKNAASDFQAWEFKSILKELQIEFKTPEKESQNEQDSLF